MANSPNFIPNGLGYDGNWSTSSLAATPIVQAQADPYGGTAAGKVVPDSTAGYHALIHGPVAMGPFAINTDITIRHTLKLAGMTQAGFLADFGGGNNASVTFDLSTGANLGSSASGSVVTITSASIAPNAKDATWYDCELVVRSNSSSFTFFNFHTYIPGTGNSSNGVLMYWPRVYQGTPAAERVIFVGSAKGTNTCMPPTHQAGDLFVIGAFRDGSTTLPTVGTGSPTAWTTVQNPTGANTCSAVVCSKVAASNAETVGTFTNATEVVLNVYRPASGYTLSAGASANGSGSSTTVTYPALTLQDTSGYSWVWGFAGHRSIDTTLEYCAGTKFVQTLNQLDATAEAVTQDTREGLASFGSQAQGVGGTSSGWFAFSVEIKAALAAVTLTGQAIAAAAGSVKAAIDKALTGQSLSISQGTLTPGQRITGVSATLAAGTLTPAPSKALTGQAVTSAAGALGPNISVALAGLAITASLGALAPSTAKALTGQSMTVSRGTVSVASNDVTAALTGLSMTASQGSLGKDRTVPLSGLSVTASGGSLKASASLALTGQAIAISRGTLTPSDGSVTRALTGLQITASLGVLEPAIFGIPDDELIPVVNNLEQLRKRANVILARLQILARTGYGSSLPAIDGDLDGRMFVLLTTQTLYQQQFGAWVAVDGTP
jgi:hypothetical protein